MAPGTEFARDFCGGIGPLQLDVVLVCYIFILTDGFVIELKIDWLALCVIQTLPFLAMLMISVSTSVWTYSLTWWREGEERRARDERDSVRGGGRE